MTQSRNVGQEVQAEIIKTVRRGQEAVLKGQEVVVGTVKGWADTVRSAAPQLTELKLPFADRLPKPDELLAHAHDLAGKLLASQRKLTEHVRHATAPLLPGKSDTAGQNGGQNGPAEK